MGSLTKYFLKLVSSALVVWGLVTYLFVDEVTFSDQSQTQAPAVETVSVDGLVDGTYQGVGQGFGGDLTVEVSVEGGAISSVEILDHSESAGVSDPAIEQVPAAIVEANSSEVDTVSGATMTSNGIIEAVNNALAGEGGEVGESSQEADESQESGESEEAEASEESKETSSQSEDKSEEDSDKEDSSSDKKDDKKDDDKKLADITASDVKELDEGKYEATVDGHNGPLTVEVTVKAGKIAKVEVTDHEETDGIADPALEEVPKAIARANSTKDIETVSGATVTSQAIIEAVKKALGK